VLGLAIVYTAAQRRDARLTLTSTHPGLRGEPPFARQAAAVRCAAA